MIFNLIRVIVLMLTMIWTASCAAKIPKVEILDYRMLHDIDTESFMSGCVIGIASTLLDTDRAEIFNPEQSRIKCQNHANRVKCEILKDCSYTDVNVTKVYRGGDL